MTLIVDTYSKKPDKASDKAIVTCSIRLRGSGENDLLLLLVLGLYYSPEIFCYSASGFYCHNRIGTSRSRIPTIVYVGFPLTAPKLNQLKVREEVVGSIRFHESINKI